MTETISEWVERHVELLRPLGQRLSLDQIGEVVGAQPIGQAHIEALFDALEGAGITVDRAGTSVVDLLRRVLHGARQLRAADRAPTPEAIAAQVGISVREVRVALLFADVLRR